MTCTKPKYTHITHSFIHSHKIQDGAVGEMKAQLDGLRTNTKSPLRVHHAKSPHDLVHNVESLYLIYRERLQKFEEGVEELVERGYSSLLHFFFSLFL
jgi:hypothetical protein